MSLVFFVLKKNGKKRMVHDYRYLNSWTIKNNYPLPLISDLIDNIGKKKVFMKMDLRWGYNNVRIKEKDNSKIAFSMSENVFEPTGIFFALTKSLVIFQTMMNNLLRNIIETKDVVVFIDDVMVGIEIEKRHDNIVEEVLRKMAENNLFVKPEKCIWKVREVRFLGVVIELDKVKIEKEKVQEVVNWLVLRSMKNI